MTTDYHSAIDFIITDPAWVFTNALLGVPSSDLTIVLHKTASESPTTATAIAKYFQNDTKEHKSCHFIVGKDGSVLQVVLLKDGAGANCCLEANHAPYWDRLLATYGNLNKCTISIEHEDWSIDNSDPMTGVQVQASFQLIRWLVQRYNLSPFQIKTHASLDPGSRARCPGPTYPLAQLINFLTEAPSVDYQKQAAESIWFSVVQNPQGFHTGIAEWWYGEYKAGRFHGPPLTKELAYTNWDGKSGVVQVFPMGQVEFIDSQLKWVVYS